MMQMMGRAATDLAPAQMIAGAIPLIDIAGHIAGDAESSQKAAAQLRWSFENVGFYYLAGHVPRVSRGRGPDASSAHQARGLCLMMVSEPIAVF
jgi:hypothetical protein